jgi:hypothetical protein
MSLMFRPEKPFTSGSSLRADLPQVLSTEGGT